MHNQASLPLSLDTASIVMNNLLLVLGHEIVVYIGLSDAELRIFKLIKSDRAVEFSLWVSDGPQRILLPRHSSTLKRLLAPETFLDVEFRRIMLIVLAAVVISTHAARPLIDGVGTGAID